MPRKLCDVTFCSQLRPSFFRGPFLDALKTSTSPLTYISAEASVCQQVLPRHLPGISDGAFQVGVGPNLSKHNSVFGEFMWQGLPASRKALSAIVKSPNVNPLIVSNPVNNLSTSSNLYALTANYMYHMEGRRYGLYPIAGGGWYYRHAALNNYTIQPGAVCQPVWDWYGYTCVNGSVATEECSLLPAALALAARECRRRTYSISLGDTDGYKTKFYIEARYHYSPQGGRIPTKVVPVTFGFRW